MNPDANITASPLADQIETSALKTGGGFYHVKLLAIFCFLESKFKEKIFIFESRLDDMAIELAKVAISQTVSKKLDGVKVEDGYLSLFDRESNTMGFTYFTGEERTLYVQTARLEIYGKSKEIVDQFALKDKKLKGFIKIDREWAENILYRYKRARRIEKLNKLKE